MSWLNKHAEVKLDLLNSLARSQMALARMMESLADVTEQSADTAAKIRDNIEAITEYQKTMAEKVMGISLPDTIRTSDPSSPWTNDKLRVLGLGNRSLAVEDGVAVLTDRRKTK